MINNVQLIILVILFMAELPTRLHLSTFEYCDVNF